MQGRGVLWSDTGDGEGDAGAEVRGRELWCWGCWGWVAVSKEHGGRASELFAVRVVPNHDCGGYDGRG